MWLAYLPELRVMRRARRSALRFAAFFSLRGFGSDLRLETE
jgi:hypothetical protein